MTTGKRILDVVLVVLMSIALIPFMLVIAAVLWIRQGRPIFFVSERMKQVDKGFNLWKFRTMDMAQDDLKASGGHKNNRITPTGAWLRKHRMDELPQLWNIFIGDISFVGPRPPLRRYVEMFPMTYGRVLKSRPGVTGLATLLYHREEERLLGQSQSPKETEEIYTKRCIPRKAQLDLIYGRRRNICLDIRLIAATVRRRWAPASKHSKQTRRPN